MPVPAVTGALRAPCARPGAAPGSASRRHAVFPSDARIGQRCSGGARPVMRRRTPPNMLGCPISLCALTESRPMERSPAVRWNSPTGGTGVSPEARLARRCRHSPPSPGTVPHPTSQSTPVSHRIERAATSNACRTDRVVVGACDVTRLLRTETPGRELGPTVGTTARRALSPDVYGH